MGLVVASVEADEVCVRVFSFICKAPGAEGVFVLFFAKGVVVVAFAKGVVCGIEEGDDGAIVVV